jgi:hypothetical protein
MADQNHNSIFGDQGTGPDKPSQAEGEDFERGDMPGAGRPKDVGANDEDREPGRLRSDRPERPSTAGDQANPRTGPIG